LIPVVKGDITKQILTTFLVSKKMKNNKLKHMFLLISSSLIIIGFIVFRFAGCENDPAGIHLTSIEVKPRNSSAPIGRKVKFKAIGHYSDKRIENISEAVMWSSSDSSKAKISNTVGVKGGAVLSAEGKVFIVATDFVQGVSGTAALTIGPSELISIKVNPPMHSIHLGSFCKFTATGIYVDGSTRDLTSILNWSSANTSAQIVSNSAGSKGMCISPPSGSVKIIATDPDSGKSGESTLSVKNIKLSSISIVPADSSVPIGGSRQFVATGTYEDETTNDVTMSVVWTSLDPSTATVSNANSTIGLAQGVSVGVVVIKATESNFDISGSTTLKITPPVLLSLAITPLNPSVFVKDKKSFTATGIYSDGRKVNMTSTVVWESSDVNIAFMGIDGRAETRNSGTVKIKVLDPLSNISGDTVLTVFRPVLKKIKIVPRDPSAFLGKTRQFKAIGVFSDKKTKNMTQSVRWSSSKRNIAKINSNGRATAILDGETKIIAVDTDSGVTGKTVFRSEAPKLLFISIIPPNLSIHLGKNQAFSATGTFSDGNIKDVTASLKWSSSQKSVAAISGETKGKVIAKTVSEGVTSISVADPDSGVKKETVLTVTPAQLMSIKIDSPKAVFSLGSSQRLTASGVFTDGKIRDVSGSVSWSSSDSTVVTVSNDAGRKGIATALSIGAAEIIAKDPHSGISSKTIVAGRALW